MSIRICALAAALFVLSVAQAASGQKQDAEKALREIVEGEKYIEGKAVRKNPNIALKHFGNASKLFEIDVLTEHLAGRIALGSGKAYLELKKYKEAADALRPLAAGDTGRFFRWKGPVWGQGPAIEWSKALQKAREEIESGTAAPVLGEDLKKITEAAGSDPRNQGIVKAAAFLLGLVADAAKKHKDAAEAFLPLAEEQSKYLDQEGKRRIESDQKRVKTPATPPGAEAPPRELKGDYLKAVTKGLDWLAKFQKEDGEWSEAALADLCKDDPLPPGRVKAYPNAIAGALACMSFLRAGVKLDDSKHGQALAKGLAWARDHQAEDGTIPAGTQAWASVTATAQYAWVFAEAALRLDDPEPWKVPLKKAVEFLLVAQNPGYGWRFGIKPGDNDATVTTQALIALARAKTAGIEVPEAAFEGGIRWLDSVTDEVYGKTGFTSKGDSGAMRADGMKFKPADDATAMALAARVILGQDPRKGLLARGYDTLWARPPDWIPDKDIHLLYGRYYTLAYALRPGADANYNLKRYADMLLKNQEKSGSAEGSWPPIGAFAADGRIVATARVILSIINARGVNLPEPLKPEKGK